MCLSNVCDKKTALRASVRFSLTSEDVLPLPVDSHHQEAANAPQGAAGEGGVKKGSRRSNSFCINNNDDDFFSLKDHEDNIFSEVFSEEPENPTIESCPKDEQKIFEVLITRNRFPQDSSNPKEMKKSFSFHGFSMLRRASFPAFNPALCEMTNQELATMVHPTKPEPSKISKQQIKEYSSKYKHLKDEEKQKMPWYKDPLEYTQPAHLVAIIAFIYLAFRLFPDSRRSQTEASTLTRLLYVSSISAVFGSQFWMTFVSGLALFFTVSRHIFAKVQAVLFPLYFLTNSALMLVVIVTYTQHHPTHLWDNHQLIQGGMLVFGFIVNLGIRLYLAPVLTKLITIKIAIESETGLGSEIGSNRPGVLSRCPHYMRLYRTFRKIHMVIAIGNMAAMAATSFHLYYLATKLCSVHL